MSRGESNARVLDRKWIAASLSLVTELCVWKLCEQKAAELNATPVDVLAWLGLWRLDAEVRDMRPVDGCECPLCRDARWDDAQIGGAR